MRILRSVLVTGVLCLAAWGQSTTPDVGSGAPNVLIQQQFQLAYYRNGFASLVSYPPLADVRRLGTNGLVQEFADAAKSSGVKLALVMPNLNASVVQGVTPVFQIQGAMYAYFSQVGVSTAGMPIIDTANCPTLTTVNSCQFQLFDKPYALFVFKNPVDNAGTTYFTRDPYYTRWNSIGINSFGPAVSAETAVTSPAGNKATAQYFDRGAIYNVTSGTNTGRLLAVRAPIYNVYATNNSDHGFLGLPTGDELTLTNGHVRQSFEGGSIEYDPANPSSPPVLRNPVSNITVSAPASSIHLNLGETATLQALVVDINGAALSDRQIGWTTSNGRVLSVQQNGASAIVKGVGGGSATVTASSEGKTSSAITFIVTSPCCQIGEGAPTSAIAQAFQDAVNRSKLAVQLPATSAVARVGLGYVQQFEAVGASGAVYLVAVSDRALSGFVVAGKLLTRYLELGGPAGTLGYPASDATVGGRQNFENATLAGNPVQLVSGDILSKWAILGYETGLAGSPLSAPTDDLTFRATQVHSQAFQNALLASVVNGASTKVYTVSGLILATFTGTGGPSGRLGAPIGDETGINNRRHQEFEGGFIDFAPGDTIAATHESARSPVVTAAPATVLAGTRVRLAAGGFDNGATIRVSISGQTDFTAVVASGAYVWENFVASDAKSGSVTVRAVDTSNSAKTAQASYTIRALADIRGQLTATRGDAQTGAPGAVLSAPLVVTLRDEVGNPVAGSVVKFTASPGAKIESASAMTGSNGEASATVRLPGTEGVALFTVEGGRDVATLSARAVHTSLANFPKLSQAVQGTLGNSSAPIAEKGALLTAAASIVRYYQLRSEAPMPNGLADPSVLNAFLKTACAPDSQSVPICDGFLTVGGSTDPLVNLWRVPSFAGNGLDVTAGPTGTGSIRDSIGRGVPVLIALGLPSGASHFVVATGVGADSSILIMDPDPASARTTLEQYLAEGATVTGTATFTSQPFRGGGFLVVANTAVKVSSALGFCGSNFEIVAPQSGGSGRVQFLYCDGTAEIYEIDLNAAGSSSTFADSGTVNAYYDLSGGTAYKAVRSGTVWSVSPLDLTLTPAGILNAASFTSGISPGGLITIFGAGFGTNSNAVQVDFGGVPGKVIAAFPFQINVQVPPSLGAGAATVRVTAPTGTAQQDILLTATAPAIFTLSGSQGAILNRDNTINSPRNPAKRGDFVVVFGTGLGAVVADGALMRTQVSARASLGGVSVPILFSGLAPGFTGLYQINVSLPSSLAPGLTLPLTIQQGNSTSNTVQVAVQ